MAERSFFWNLNGLNSPSQVFADVIKETANYSSGAGSDGWPTGDFATLLYDADSQNFVNGTHAIRHQGVASPPVFGGASVTEASYAHDATADITTLLATFAAGSVNNAAISFAATQRTQTSAVGTGLVGLQIMRPTADPTVPHGFNELFSRHFLASIKDAKGLRMLDLSLCNGNPAAASYLSQTPDVGPTSPLDRYLMPQADRRFPTEPSQRSSKAKGVAFEYLIALANADPRRIKGNQDLYFNVEDYASDDYIQFLFQAARWGTNGIYAYTGPAGSTVTPANPRPQPAGGPEFPGLAPGSRLFLEPSNEINFNFDQGFEQRPRYSRLAQYEVVLNNDPNGLNWDNLPNTPGNVGLWTGRRVGWLIKRISDIGRATLGDAAYGTFFFPVLMGQNGNAGAIQPALDYLVYKVGIAGVKSVITHLGAAGYRGQNTVDYADGGLTVDQVFGSGIRPEAEPAVHAAIAALYGLRVLLYEIGWNFGEAAVSNLTKAVKIDARAGRLARQTLDDLFYGSSLVDIVGMYADTRGSYAHWNTSLNTTGADGVKGQAIIAGGAAWQANPADGRSTDPPVPTAKITGVTIAPITTAIVPGGTLQLVGTITGINGPILTAAWNSTAGAVDGTGLVTIPPAANQAQSFTVTCTSTADSTRSQSVTITVAADPNGPPPVADSSFEAYQFAQPETNNSHVQGSGITGTPWSFTDGAGISAVNSDFTSSNAQTAYGGQVALIQNYGTITQTVPGWPAGTFTLTVVAAQRTTNGATLMPITVRVDGVAVATITPTDATYRPYTTPAFTLTAGSHAVQFFATAANATVFLDNVTLASVGVPPPPPPVIVTTTASLRMLLDRLHIH